MATMHCIDYAHSFVCTSGPKNSPRFWVESRCRLIDEKHGTKLDYYQCGSCKSENTFAKKNLFIKDNYDFLPVFGEDSSFVLFRRHVYCNSNYAECGDAGSALWRNIWGTCFFKIKEAKSAHLLKNNKEIIQATNEGKPVIARTEIWNMDTKMRVIIEYPVKTKNINEEKMIYQVDTGPVIFPDITRRYTRKVESLHLAFVAFNVPQFADFVIEEPTPVIKDGKEVCLVYHYSRIESLESRNSLFVIL